MGKLEKELDKIKIMALVGLYNHTYTLSPEEKRDRLNQKLKSYSELYGEFLEGLPNMGF